MIDVMQGYTNCINVRDAADGTTVDWEYRTRLDKAARSGSNAKLEVAKVCCMFGGESGGEGSGVM